MTHSVRLRLLRALIGLALISFVGALAWLLLRREPPAPPEALPPALVASPEETKQREVSNVALDFDVTRTHEGRDDFRLRAERVLGLEGDLYQLRRPELTVYHDDGTETQVTGLAGVFDTATEEGRIEGDARAAGSGGILVQSAALHYRRGGEMLEAEGEARFERPGLVGSGEGLRFDPIAGRLSLDREVHVQGRGADGSWDLSAQWLEYFPDREALRTGSFRLDAESGTLIGDVLDLELSGESSVRRMTATGDALLTWGEETEAAGPVELAGERVIVEPAAGEDREPRRVESIGSAVLTSRPAGGGVRRLASERIVLRGAGGGGREVEAFGSVRLRDAAEDGVTELASPWLRAFLGTDGELRAGRAEGGVVAVGPRGTLRGENASFEGGTERMDIEGTAGNPAVLEDDDGRVAARRIQLDRRDGRLTAEGSVRTLSRTGARGGAGLFDSGAPVQGTADRLVAHRDPERAIYEGAVRLWQGESLLQADRAEVRRTEGRLEAEGRVITRSVRAAPEGGAPDLLQGSARHFTFDDEEGRAVYQSGAVLQWSSRRVEAERIEVRLDQRREVRRVLADGEVLLEADGLRAEGDRLDYDLDAGRAVLSSSGRLAEAQDLTNQRLVRGSSLTFELSDATIAVESAPGGRTWVTLPAREESPRAPTGGGPDGEVEREGTRAP